jgi:hypothetical protein
MIRHCLPRLALLSAAAFSALLPVSTYATVGVDSAGGGVIGAAHAAHAAGLDLGRTVAFIQYGGGTATGTLVPSSEPGVLKFLTAAHNVESNNDGVLDAGAANITLFFGNTPGTTGATATYSVVATPAQIAMNPNWATSGGSATHDMAVVSFTFAQIAAITGGPSTLQTSAVSSTNPLGGAAILGGHGLFADGTVNLGGEENPEDQVPDAVPPGARDVNGVLKTGTNTVDFVGVPGAIAPPTISPASGK